MMTDYNISIPNETSSRTDNVLMPLHERDSAPIRAVRVTSEPKTAAPIAGQIYPRRKTIV